MKSATSALSLALGAAGAAVCAAQEAWTPTFTSASAVTILNGTAGYVPLPALADNFEAVIEANIYNSGYTIHMHEWHDVDADAGRTDTYSQRGGSASSSVYDYGNNRYVEILPKSLPTAAAAAALAGDSG